MKRILALCAVMCLLCGCSSGTVTESPGASAQDGTAETESPGVSAQAAAPVSAAIGGEAGGSAPVGNPSPIPALRDVTEDDLGDVYWWCDDYSNGRMWGGEGTVDIWWGGEQPDRRMWGLYSDQKTALLAALQDIQLLDKGSDEGMTPRLKFDIRFKNAESLSVLFIGDCVDFGGGLYHYKDYSNAGYPDEAYAVYINTLANDARRTYDDQSDVEALMKALATTPCPAPEALCENALDVFSVYISCPDFDFNKSYMVVQTDEAIYVVKRFFTLSVCLGELGDDAFAQLKDAENDQFGSHCSLSITSGGVTIRPPGVLANSRIYDCGGGWLCGDGFPNIADYADRLQSVTLDDDFSVWTKSPDQTRYVITTSDNETINGDTLTRSAFDGLPAGSYPVEVYVTINGQYYESLDGYEYTTNAYFFQVEVP